jgi:hypothetical protein
VAIPDHVFIALPQLLAHISISEGLRTLMGSNLRLKFYSLITRFILASFLSFVVSVSSEGQSLKGKITEDGRTPIPFATIYIDKTHSGTTANLNGEYELPLDSGFYIIKFRAIGYKTISHEIHISSKSRILNVTLSLEAYEMKEVIVRPNGENLANIIMRKAIAWAPYYLRYVQHYTSEVYLKGSLKLDNIPKILASRMIIKFDNKEIKPYSGMTFIDESVNEVSFDSPDHFIQKVKSSRSTMPGLGGQPITPMELIKENFYQPDLMECISPLSVNALEHYKFVYEGYSEEDNFLIYKIKVIPRRKSQQLFTGTIYIVDRYWCLYSVSLSAEPFWGNVIINQVYTQLEGSAWLPMTHSFFFDASYLGIKGTYKYSAAVKYRDIKVNQSLQGPVKEVTSAMGETNSNKPKFAAAEKMNGIQMRRLAKKNRALTNKNKPDTIKSLELKPHVKISVDPGAMKQDSSYWNAIRPIPLTSEDIKGYAKFDSIINKQKSIAGDSLSRTKKKARLIAKFIIGTSWHFNDSTIHIRYFGPLNPKSFQFNTVDGWRYHQYLELSLQADSIHELKFTPSLDYGFSRQTLLATIEGSYSYSPLKRGEIFFKAGSTSCDFNENSGINPYINSLSSLFFRDNYMKLFNYKYLIIGNKIDLTNGLLLVTAVSYNSYGSLKNNSNFSFFYNRSRDYSSNIPDNSVFKFDSSGIVSNFLISMNLEFTPEYYYFVRKNRKIMHESKYPTFSLGFNYAFPAYGSGSSYSSMEMGIKQIIDIGNWSMFRYSIKFGSFFNSNRVLFPDYNHLNTQTQAVMVGTFFDSYQLLDYYKSSSAQGFFELKMQYRSQLLLLKRLPLLSDRIWSENVYFKYAYNVLLNHYFETGYGMGNILGLANIGIFMAYQDFRYKSTGLKLCLGIDRIR